jgi:hypothetical protein
MPSGTRLMSMRRIHHRFHDGALRASPRLSAARADDGEILHPVVMRSDQSPFRRNRG